jgi:hypothetical protein
MATLLFTCPKTRLPVPTGVATDVQGLRRSWALKLQLSCPPCGQNHELAVRDTYLDAAIDAAVGRWAPSK